MPGGDAMNGKAGALERSVRQESPYNAETPVDLLTGDPVPPSLFYVRDHFRRPALDPSAWRLRVGGEVERTLEMGLEELRALPYRSFPVTMECAGNGRRFMEPPPEGAVPWEFGAAATAEFGGTALSNVLERAGLSDGAVEVAFIGADEGPVTEGRHEPYARSLPRAMAFDPDTLLAWEMNGEPLTAEHGHPLRLVVPSWYGMASVKWLVRITALPEPFDGHFQTRRYTYFEEEGTPHRTPCTTKRVRAVISRPVAGQRIPRAPVAVTGGAWSGAGRVVRVEVSADDGRSWEEAVLEEPPGRHAAAPWRWTWTPSRAGEHVLLARATDEAGRRQPLEPGWNRYGYGNNVVQRVRVRVE